MENVVVDYGKAVSQGTSRVFQEGLVVVDEELKGERPYHPTHITSKKGG